jgi:hypothetical protein
MIFVHGVFLKEASLIAWGNTPIMKNNQRSHHRSAFE